MPVHNCAFCKNGSLVRSNYRFSISGKPYCKSEKRPECEQARIKENERICPQIKDRHD